MATSTVALLGTLRELHASLPGYDWRRLEGLVASKRPDLLCLEVDRAAWESGNLADAPVESRAVLAPLTMAGDITLVPLGGGGRDWSHSGVRPPAFGRAARLRALFATAADHLIVGLMRLAGGPRAINSPMVEHICHALCALQAALADPESRQAWQQKNEELLEGLRWILRRDPGGRVLVAVDCRRKHWLRRRLRSLPEAKLVDFWRF